MAVVKADAYGHGAVRVSRFIENSVDGFAVATVDEAVELRANDVKKPILVLGYTLKDRCGELVRYDLEQAVSSLEYALYLADAAKGLGRTVKIAIALDTGMGRIGFLPEKESALEILKICERRELLICSIFSHFASSDEPEKSYAQEQEKRFSRFVKKLDGCGINIPVKHISNSAAIIDMDLREYQMARAGIILYGVYPSDSVSKEKISLLPALEWKARVVHLKSVPKGTPISYGSTYVTTQESTRIATVGIGYGDGYPRALSNRGRVLIRGVSCAILGRICMDMLMADASELTEVFVEDEVTLIGRDGAEFISIDELAQLSGTISYEIATNIGKRVPRKYIV